MHFATLIIPCASRPCSKNQPLSGMNIGLFRGEGGGGGGGLPLGYGNPISFVMEL